MTEASGSVGILPLHSLTEEQHRQNIMIGVSIATTLVSLGCVGLRVYTRAFIVRNIGPEDWTMMAAAASCARKYIQSSILLTTVDFHNDLDV
jgi:hypothetical protein